MKNYLKHLTPLGVLVGSLCLAVIFLACVLVGKLDPPKTADSGFPPAGVGSEAATKRSGRTGPPPLVAPGPAAFDDSPLRGEVSHVRSTDPGATRPPRVLSTDQAGLRLAPSLILSAIDLAWFRESDFGQDPNCYMIGPANEQGQYRIRPIFIEEVKRISGFVIDPHDNDSCRYGIYVYLSYWGPRVGAQTVDDLYELYRRGPTGYREWKGKWNTIHH